MGILPIIDMNKLPAEKRAAILTLLCEGSSLRAVTRITGVSLDTVTKLLIGAGQACERFHDATVRNVRTERIQCDEIWSFTYAKAKNVADAKAAPEGAGDTWTWTALDADTKLIIGWLVGGRDAGYAQAFMQDVASRLATRIQLTTDAHKPYLEAVEGAFGADVDRAPDHLRAGQPRQRRLCAHPVLREWQHAVQQHRRTHAREARVRLRPVG
jgi:IS1 family transposase